MAFLHVILDAIQTMSFAEQTLLLINSLTQTASYKIQHKQMPLETVLLNGRNRPSWGSSRGEAYTLKAKSKQGLRSRVSTDRAVGDCRKAMQTSDLLWHVGRGVVRPEAKGKRKRRSSDRSFLGLWCPDGVKVREAMGKARSQQTRAGSHQRSVNRSWRSCRRGERSAERDEEKMKREE